MKIVLDCGHGGSDPGAVFRGHLEKDISLAVGIKLADLLGQQGHDVLMTREDDRFISIPNRVLKANDFQADIFISLHMNADQDEDLPGMREARGAEIWCFPESRAGRRLASCIGGEILLAFPDEPWRGIKEDDLGVLYTDAPAVLIEMGFVDNSHTIRQMSDPDVQGRMAWAIARGLRDYLRPNLAA